MPFFDVDSTFFRIFGYPMSYLEFTGTVLYLLSVWLVARNSILTWPVGNVAVILFGVLFYQVQLYSDLIEQIYFLLTGFYGWWVWIRLRRGPTGNLPERGGISRLSPQGIRLVVTILLIGTLGMGFLTSNLHEFLPVLFPTPAAFPYLDAFTTVMSFAAQILMAHKKLENWYLWITVDIIGIGLYYVRGVRAISLLYAIFLVLAVKGLLNWNRQLRGSRVGSQQPEIGSTHELPPA